MANETAVKAKQNREAYRKAVEELKKDRITEVKTLVKECLERVQKAEKRRRDAVDEIQILKRDLEDLKRGRLDKIKERHEKDAKADRISPLTPQKIQEWMIAPQYASNSILLAPASYTRSAGALSSMVGAAAEGTYVLTDGAVKHV